jgi:hypothetical protein
MSAPANPAWILAAILTCAAASCSSNSARDVNFGTNLGADFRAPVVDAGSDAAADAGAAGTGDGATGAAGGAAGADSAVTGSGGAAGSDVTGMAGAEGAAGAGGAG